MKWSLALLVALAALAGPATAGVIVVTFDPLVSFIAPVGGTAQVNLVADIPADSPVLGWGLDLDIVNPAVAALVNVSVAAPWTQVSGDGDGLGGLAFPNGVTGNDIVLATLTLQGLSQGTSLMMVSATQGDLTEGFALDPTGFGLFVAPCGAVVVTPEPATLVLLAVAGFMVRRR